MAIALAQVKPALLGGTAIGPEDRFPRERFGAGERVMIDEERVVHTVEQDRLPHHRLDHRRLPEDGRLVAPDVLEPIESPDLGRRLSRDNRAEHQRRGEPWYDPLRRHIGAATLL